MKQVVNYKCISKNKDVNNDELFRRSPKNLEQSDTESFNHGEGNESMNDWSKYNRQLSKFSAAIDADRKQRAINRFDDDDDYNNWCLLYQRLYLTIIDVIRWLLTIMTIYFNGQQLMMIIMIAHLHNN